MIFFRVEDGIHMSPGGLQSKSITDDDLYPLFPHEGSLPQAVFRLGVAVWPPDDTRPQLQKFSIVQGYLYYDYMDVNNFTRTLVYDIAAGGWVWDNYLTPTSIHAANDGESVQGTLTGGADGTIRQMLSTGGTEAVVGVLTTAAIGGAGWQHIRAITLEYTSSATITLRFIPADQNGSYGPPQVTLPSTGGNATKYYFVVGANKWKWLQFQFSFTDPTAQIYIRGMAVEMKAWGSAGAYRPVMPFGQSGGEGAEG
jgi:hypothetical protein